jgi:hypothetical protein
MTSGLGMRLQAPRHKNGDRDEQTSTHTFMLVKGWDVTQAYQRIRSRSIRSQPAHLSVVAVKGDADSLDPSGKELRPDQMKRGGSKGESGN